MDATSESRKASRWWMPALAALVVIFAGLSWLRVERPEPEARMEDLVLEDGILRWSGNREVFEGRLVSRDSEGRLRSASGVRKGRLHGLSRGWHENGAAQVEEHFVQGVSEGIRTKWRADGTRESEASIHAGKLHGRFTRWDVSGALSEEAQFQDGVAVGEARQWHPDGSLRSWCRLEGGQVVESKRWSPGECRSWPVQVAKAR